MSAKGRKRNAADVSALFPGDVAPGVQVVAGRSTEFYPTEPWVVEALLESPMLVLPGGLWIEPCAGTGSIVRAVNRLRSDVRWILCDIDEQFGPYLGTVTRPRSGDVLLPFGDFVTREWTQPIADVLIMNPPFSLTIPFLEAAFKRARKVVMLQRLNWYGTKERANWLRKHQPDIYGLPRRPSFTGDGSTDATEYAWFHFPVGGAERRKGMVAMLDMPTGGQVDLALGGAA